MINLTRLKMTNQKNEDKTVKDIVQEIILLEKKYPANLIEKACVRYKNSQLEQRKAKSQIEILERKLQIAKSKLK